MSDWPLTGIPKVTAFPVGPTEGDQVVRTDLLGSPTYKYTSGGWEQQPRMGGVTVPSVKAVGSAALSIPNTVQTAITYPDADAFDTNSMHDPAVSSQNITVNTPGFYFITGGVFWAASGSGYRELILNVNGVVDIADDTDPPTASAFTHMFPGRILKLAAGDVIRLDAWQNSGGALNITSRTLIATWLGGAGQTVDERGVPSASVVRNATNQSIPNATMTAVTFEAEEYDTDNIADLATQTARLTIKTPGLYRLSGALVFAASATGLRLAALRKNGSTILQRAAYPAASGVDYTETLVSTDAVLAAGDYIELLAYQSSGGALNVRGDDPAARPRLQAALIGSAKTVTPYARATKSAVQSIPNNASTAITFDTEESDNDGIHDTVTNNTRLTARTAGVYNVSAMLTFAASSAGGRGVSIVKNGSTYVSGSRQASIPTAANVMQVNASGNVELAVGDYVEATAYQDSGGALNVNGGDGTYFSMVKVGAPLAGSIGVEPIETNHLVGATGEPAFENGFANYDTVNYSSVAFYKDRGRIFLQGHFTNALANKNADGQQIFTLPAGYRPSVIKSSVCNANNAFGLVRIYPSGHVVIVVGNTTFGNLDGASISL